MMKVLYNSNNYGICASKDGQVKIGVKLDDCSGKIEMDGTDLLDLCTGACPNATLKDGVITMTTGEKATLGAEGLINICKFIELEGPAELAKKIKEAV